jgi:uncharacterized protein Yka (UPF0111/DUF47 family)
MLTIQDTAQASTKHCYQSLTALDVGQSLQQQSQYMLQTKNYEQTFDKKQVGLIKKIPQYSNSSKVHNGLRHKNIYKTHEFETSERCVKLDSDLGDVGVFSQS